MRDETITAKRLAAIIAAGRTVFPYPRLGLVSVDGKRRQPATPAAVKLAVAELRRWKASR